MAPSNTITLAVAATPYNSPDWLVNVLCNIYSEVHSIVFLLTYSGPSGRHRLHL